MNVDPIYAAITSIQMQLDELHAAVELLQHAVAQLTLAETQSPQEPHHLAG
jgi:hypothetical protein